MVLRWMTGGSSMVLVGLLFCGFSCLGLVVGCFCVDAR